MKKATRQKTLCLFSSLFELLFSPAFRLQNIHTRIFSSLKVKRAIMMINCSSLSQYLNIVML